MNFLSRLLRKISLGPSLSIGSEKEQVCITIHACEYTANFNGCKNDNFNGCKNDNFQLKNCDIFPIFSQNIDCGYTLELPH